MPTIAIIHSGSHGNPDHDKLINTFILSLKQEGFVDGQGGFSIHPGPQGGPVHWGNDDPNTLATHVNNLANTVDVLVAGGGTRSSQIARGPTQGTITKVVFTSVTTPVRPATHMTGICAYTADFDRKRLSLLQELKPNQNKFGVLYNSERFKQGDPNTQKADLDAAAAALGLPPLSYQDVGTGTGHGGDPNKIKQALFTAWLKANPPITAALVAADSFFNNHRLDLIKAANTPGFATIYQWREFVDAGGLMSYGPKLSECYKLAAIYTASILRNTQPQDLPVLPVTSFELVINLTTADTLGISIPESLLTRANDIVV